MLIESSEVDQVVLVCGSDDCGGREADHESETVAYWETPDSGTLVTRKTCRRCSLATIIRRWVGPARPPSHDCGYYSDSSGLCSYCTC
ncbi:hypothetical protein OG558_43870 [Kribbella sp. NBC_01510]|jgi:hypothetical protein|uniref:hypothetical protein n=1 Tax=unclassified Kribbella TaxID=2644121 RepID=UPI002E34AABD|nr:hypothetical protein [Kribbella sp. NBC_01484]